MNTYELIKVLELHEKWLRGKDGGKRANLEGANLKGANLKGANLRSAYLEDANLEDANLEDANLRSAYLEDAYLKGANLEDANLEDANLKFANLEDANLRSAYLKFANLEGAYLKGANLKGVELWNTTGNNVQIRTVQLGEYVLNYTSNIIQIGCRNHSIEEWFGFSDKEIDLMDSNALAWWNECKDIIKQIIEISPAQPT